MSNVLVIGSGGREHALVAKLALSGKVKKLYAAPGNPGISQLAETVDIKPTDLKSLLKFALQKKIDITIVGPESALIAGITDIFQKHKLKIIGPTKKAARIEGSKVYAKKLLLWNKIPTADFAVFDDYALAGKFLKTRKYPLVIKAEGQCLGKGVFIASDEKSAQKAIREIFVKKIFNTEGKRIIIEECLEGKEVSFMVATDGKDFVSFLPSQDHKRVNDNDQGPNTGGMGAYAPVPFVDSAMNKRIEKEIIKPILKAMRDHDNPYKGILYPGLILTPQGPKVLEFNCRFGDPETQPVMELLKTDLMDVFLAISNNTVGKLKLKWHRGYAACVVLTSEGYPGKYKKGREIRGLDKNNDVNGVRAYHSGTRTEKGKILTDGGRVLGIAARGKDLKDALKKVYQNIGKTGINFEGMHYRKDIGKKDL